MLRFGLVFLCAWVAWGQRGASPANPTVAKIVSEVSQDRIDADLKKLESFGTRFVLSPQIHEAENWIAGEFQSYSPRLEVTRDVETTVFAGNPNAETKLVNVIAKLPGTRKNAPVVIISAHYDTVALIEKADAGAAKALADLKKAGKTAAQAKHLLEVFPLDENQWGRDIDWKATAASRAPGVTDDGSGTAAVMELARVIGRYQFDKTILFIAFSGEEIGLRGSFGFARKAKEQKMAIEAVLNNDIIGSDVGGDGTKANNTLRVYSGGPEDSAARSLARYTKEIAEKYVPEMKVEMVFREDRFGRGGDHSSFWTLGYPAVRLTTPAEDFSHQHTVSDTYANTSVTYTTEVAKMNAAVLASLALAPAPPVITLDNRPMISRGKSHYDAVVRWEPNKEEDLGSYSVLTRASTSADWEREINVGKVKSYSFPNLSIDDLVIGVRANDQDGNPSLVSAYVTTARTFPKDEGNPMERWVRVAVTFAGLGLAWVLVVRRGRVAA